MDGMAAAAAQTIDDAPRVASVVVCTYNRCESLADTLQAIGAQQVAAGLRWNLIVVDNNSRDGTRAVVERFQASRPELSVQYLFEPKQGLSHARNLGIAAADGCFIVFTDDDVLPAPDWLQTLVDGMQLHGCSAAGGHIAPLWQAPPPAWLTERFHGFLALRTETGEAREVRAQEDLPFGASMAFVRRVFDDIGGFDAALGRKGNTLAAGEEIDVLMRIIQRGGRVMYLPQARVRHKVEAFRLSKRYFRRWRYQCSLNEAAALPRGNGRHLGRVPLYMLPQLLRAVGKTVQLYIAGPADLAFRQEMIVWHFLGTMRGLQKQA